MKPSLYVCFHGACLCDSLPKENLNFGLLPKVPSSTDRRASSKSMQNVVSLYNFAVIQ